MTDAPSESAFDLFLVHASAHKVEARALADALAPSARVFLDEHSLPPGALYDTAIPRALEEARVVVVIVGPNDDSAHHQRAEIQRAVRRLREGTCSVVPVLLEGVEPGSKAIPYGLERSHALRMSAREVSTVAERLLTLARVPVVPTQMGRPSRRTLWAAVGVVAIAASVGVAVFIQHRAAPDAAATATAFLAAWDASDVPAIWDMFSARTQSSQAKELTTAQLLALRQAYGGPVSARTRILVRAERRHPVTLAPAAIDHLRFEVVVPVGAVCEDLWIITGAREVRHVDVFTAVRATTPHCDGERELADAEAAARRFADALARSDVKRGDERWFTAQRLDFDREAGETVDRYYEALRRAGPYNVDGELWSALTSQPFPQNPRFGAFAIVILETVNPLGARFAMRVVLERTGEVWRVDQFELTPMV